MSHTSLYRRIWRWHFFAGLFVAPFAILLAVTGTVYLFADEIEATIDRGVFAGAAVEGSILPADRLVSVALEAHSGSRLIRYVIPPEGAPAARVHVRTETGARLLWVDRRDAVILRDVAEGDRFLSIIRRIHSTILAGKFGNRMVELAASLMIILIITGVWLHWPRGRRWVGAFLPDLRAGGRAFWRSLHGSVGLVAGIFILGLLFSGLPWTGVWGKQFSNIRTTMGWTGPGQEWFVTLKSTLPGENTAEQAQNGDGLKLWATDEDEGEVVLTSAILTPGIQRKSLAWVVRTVAPEHLPAPVWVQPPRGEDGVWTVRAMPRARYQRKTVHFDQWSGKEIMRIRFADHHPVDRAIGHGLSFHEGALFGVWNQIVGVLTASAIIVLSVAGLLAWLKRRPRGGLAAPPLQETPRALPIGLGVTIVTLLIFLPVAGIAVVALWSFDKAVALIRYGMA